MVYAACHTAQSSRARPGSRGKPWARGSSRWEDPWTHHFGEPTPWLPRGAYASGRHGRNLGPR